MAQHVDVIMGKINEYIDKQLVSLAQSNPLIGFTKPLISRVIANNTYKMEAVLKQIADKDGLVDAEGILSEMIEGVVENKPFKLSTGPLGELEIGGGKIKMNLPMVNKALVLNHQDLLDLKDMLRE